MPAAPIGYKALVQAIAKKQSFLCVGLDVDPKQIPKDFAPQAPVAERMLAFTEVIVQATQKMTIAYKLNSAFYEAEGAAGYKAMAHTIHMLRKEAPEALIIMDAKRGDVPHTAEKYAKAFFEELKVDAVTLSPYLGRDSIAPFLSYKDKWVILLAATSNPGFEDFQNAALRQGTRLWEQVLSTCRLWAGPDQLIFVVGATRGAEICRRARQIAPEHFFLLPGVGAQGANIEEACLAAEGKALVNASRSLLYAGQQAANTALSTQKEALNLQQRMQKVWQLLEKRKAVDLQTEHVNLGPTLGSRK